MTVHIVPSGHVPMLVHPWSSNAAADEGAAVVSPEQAGGVSQAGARAPLRLYSAVGLNPGSYLR